MVSKYYIKCFSLFSNDFSCYLEVSPNGIPPEEMRDTLKLPQSSIIKRSVMIAGHATSVSLEPEFWEVLREIATADSISVAALIRQIDEDLITSQRQNLSSAIRVFILKRLQEEAE